jgi:pimeloyl-ACP methyl ester carboxylesterase
MPEIDREGLRIYYEEHGSGVPVVLGHSFLCSGEMWAPQVGPLAETARVINIDLRGHGRSGRIESSFTLYDLVADVVAVLDQLGVERAVWAGLSIGGMVALRAALSVPDRVAALILLDAHAGAEAALKRLKYRAMGLGARLLGIRPFVPTILPLMFGATTRRTNATLVTSWKEKFDSVDVPSTLRCLDALMRRDSVLERLREIDVPTLVIVGEEDVSLPPACSEQIAAGVTGAGLLRVPKAGHLSTLEQPEAVTQAMLGFLGDLRAEEERG